jgi:hypothetical protein
LNFKKKINIKPYMRRKIKKVIDGSPDEIFPLPIYKGEDDIYSRGKKESFEDEDNSVKKELGYKDQDPGEDLDVPGAELDDSNEAIGEEDEENNYYSLGGDEHMPENYTEPDSL